MGTTEQQGFVSLIGQLAESTVRESMIGERQPLRWRIDSGPAPVLVLLEDVRLAGPVNEAVGWALFDEAGNPIWVQAFRSILSPGDTVHVEAGGLPIFVGP